MRSQIISLFSGLLVLAGAALGAETNFTPFALEGQTFIHDPSTIVRDGTNYFLFGTGPGIHTKSSPDLIHWENGDPVFRTPPEWANKFSPPFRSSFWAPDVVRVNGKFYLYYAVSTFGKQTSAIGLATNPTLDETATNYFWTDRGAVIESSHQHAVQRD